MQRALVLPVCLPFRAQGRLNRCVIFDVFMRFIVREIEFNRNLETH